MQVVLVYLQTDGRTELRELVHALKNIQK